MWRMIGFQLLHSEEDINTLQSTIVDFSKRVSNSTLWFTETWKEIHDKVKKGIFIHIAGV